MKFALASVVAINAVAVVYGRAIPEAQPEAIWDRLVGRFEARDAHTTQFPGFKPSGIQGIVPGAGTTGSPTGTGIKVVGTGTAVLTGTGTSIIGTGTSIVYPTYSANVLPQGTGIIHHPTTTKVSTQKPTSTLDPPPKPTTTTTKSSQPPTSSSTTAIDPPTIPTSKTMTQAVTSTITQPPVTVTQPPVTVTVASGSSAPATVTITPLPVTVTVTAPVVTVTAVHKGCGNNQDDQDDQDY
ncbi:hypothetical protein L873DRAFT_1791015 [Choiromyces venosus 120613-1]|uniref:Uncharacterized protein n=1 Tax=Choiromyces venosus 120613-1 TaxID=1336337 RepID=A0A3N4JGE4_9PEZI|nr:hypothetical protein L873DRAFT_1791015 [Choiromyces venosus 120613-1]